MNTVSKIEELNIEGFQIVRADMFAHMPRKSDSTCSLWPTKISFSKLCLEQLNNCEFIRIEVNPKTKYLLLVPVTSQDKDSIRWVKGAKMQYIRNLESKAFGAMIYKTWKLDIGFNYRAQGSLVSANKKIMMLFDFTNAEMWRNKDAARESEKK